MQSIIHTIIILWVMPRRFFLFIRIPIRSHFFIAQRRCFKFFIFPQEQTTIVEEAGTFFRKLVQCPIPFLFLTVLIENSDRRSKIDTSQLPVVCNVSLTILRFYKLRLITTVLKLNNLWFFWSSNFGEICINAFQKKENWLPLIAVSWRYPF